MALPSVEDLKDYGRIQTTAEDPLLASLLARAVGEIEASIGKSLTHESVVWYDDAKSLRLYERPCNLVLGYVPIDATTVSVVDADGVTVDAATYTVRQDLGLIKGDGVTFENGPYAITVTKAGFDTSPSYATRWSPMITAAVLDYALMLYQQRTPGASSEKASGTTVTYEIDPTTGLPLRIMRQVRKLRGAVV